MPAAAQVALVDRFLSCTHVPRGQLQLVGVTCAWVAAKFEEIHPPNVHDFAYITNHTYTKVRSLVLATSIKAGREPQTSCNHALLTIQAWLHYFASLAASGD